MRGAGVLWANGGFESPKLFACCIAIGTNSLVKSAATNGGISCIRMVVLSIAIFGIREKVD